MLALVPLSRCMSSSHDWRVQLELCTSSATSGYGWRSEKVTPACVADMEAIFESPLSADQENVMSYQPLPIETVALADLALDLDNYRIPVRSEDEHSALNYLYAQEEVYDTAKLILRDGYFDNEVPIVAEATPAHRTDADAPSDEIKYVVLEGNRRVSALKILADPTLIPAHEATIRALLKRYETEAEDLPSEIRVLVAPTRNAAARHIARLHTTQSKKAWSRDQQATYYYSLRGPTMTVDDIRQAYPGVNVPRFIRMAVMRRFLSGVRFRDRSLHDYVTGTQLKMSSVEYAYKNPAIASAIGVAFDKDGLLVPAGRSPEKHGSALDGQQLTAIEYLMEQFRLGNLNTRSAAFKKDSEALDELVALLKGEARVTEPGPEPDEGANADDPEDDGFSDDQENPQDEGGAEDSPGDGSGGPTGGTRDSRGPNHPDTKDHLVLTGLDYDAHASINLQRRYHELRRLKLTQTPVAAAVLLRVVLECTIKFHFEPTSTPATGELKACMATVKTAYGQERRFRSAIDKIYSGGAKVPGSVDWFNDIAHSADAVPTPDTVREALQLIHPVLRRLLRLASDATA